VASSGFWAGLLPAFARGWTRSRSGISPRRGRTATSCSTSVTLIGAGPRRRGARAHQRCCTELPGLIEIGLLSKTHIDAPSAYAITSLLSGMRSSLPERSSASSLLGLPLVAAAVDGRRSDRRPARLRPAGDLCKFRLRPDPALSSGRSGWATSSPSTIYPDGVVHQRSAPATTTILTSRTRQIVVPHKSVITGQLTSTGPLSIPPRGLPSSSGFDYGTDPGKGARIWPATGRPGESGGTRRSGAAAWFLTFGAQLAGFRACGCSSPIWADRLIVQNGLNLGITHSSPRTDINPHAPVPQLERPHPVDRRKCFGQGAPAGARVTFIDPFELSRSWRRSGMRRRSRSTNCAPAPKRSPAFGSAFRQPRAWLERDRPLLRDCVARRGMATSRIRPLSANLRAVIRSHAGAIAAPAPPRSSAGPDRPQVPRVDDALFAQSTDESRGLFGRQRSRLSSTALAAPAERSFSPQGRPFCRSDLQIRSGDAGSASRRIAQP